MERLPPTLGVDAAFADPAFLAEWNRLREERTAQWESLLEDARELGRRGWTVPMWMLPTHLFFVTRTFPDERDAVFVWAYTARNEEQFRALAANVLQHSLLERWRPLIRQAISSFRRRQYLLVVPALLTIFDGLAGLVGERLRAKADPKRVLDDHVRGAGPGLERRLWVSIQAFVHEVFRSHDFAADTPLRVNRHWVLHGRDAPRWNRADCLRLFQALDTLAVHAELAKRDQVQWLSDKFRLNAPPELLDALRRRAV